jgi:hypothetical protein
MATSGLEVAEALDSVTQDDRTKGEFQDLVGVPYAVIESDPGSPVAKYRIHTSCIDVMHY